MSGMKFVNEKVKSLSADIANTVGDLVRDAKPLLNDASHRLSHQVSDLTQETIDVANKGKEAIEKKGHDLIDHAAVMIRNEPFKAVLIAASIGAATVALVGMMSRISVNKPSQS